MASATKVVVEWTFPEYGTAKVKLKVGFCHLKCVLKSLIIIYMLKWAVSCKNMIE